MNPTVKLVLYSVLVVALALLGYGLYSALQTPPPPSPGATSTTLSNAASATVTSTPPSAATVTNTNATPTPITQATNDVKDPNQTNQAAVATSAPSPGAPDDSDITVRAPSRNLGRATAYGVAMFFVGVGLSILIARDISRYFAGQVQDFIFNDNLEGMRDPEYDEAERVWAKGEHLEAVRLMRTYLENHPREQYVALRIAEIYETDLRNYLAAALEYEEVLKKKLPAERWGWAAVHLANLYSGKLDRIPEATALLHRIVEEYGQTAAAKKARERLGIPEPIPEPSPAVEAQLAAQNAEEQEAEPEAEKPPTHNLPKGFRPK